MHPKKTLLLAIGAFALMAPALASAQTVAQDQSAVSKARAAHMAALKSGNKAQIDRTEQALRAADVNYNDDIQADRAEAGATGNPDVKAAKIAVDQARDAHEHALVSGNKAEIAKTNAALRAADVRYYSATHPKHHAG